MQPAEQLYPPIDLPTVAAAADRALDQVANLVRGLPDQSAKALPSWSIEQTAAHLMGVIGAYINLASGAASPYTDLSNVAGTNDELLTRIGTDSSEPLRVDQLQI